MAKKMTMITDVNTLMSQEFVRVTREVKKGFWVVPVKEIMRWHFQTVYNYLMAGRIFEHKKARK